LAVLVLVKKVNVFSKLAMPHIEEILYETLP